MAADNLFNQTAGRHADNRYAVSKGQRGNTRLRGFDMRQNDRIITSEQRLNLLIVEPAIRYFRIQRRQASPLRAQISSASHAELNGNALRA